MARNDWYIIARNANGYLVHKMDKDLNPSGAPYELTWENGNLYCTCYAGLQGTYCRHQKMKDLFDKTGRNGPYNFDRNEFMELSDD